MSPLTSERASIFGAEYFTAFSSISCPSGTPVALTGD